MSENQPHPQEGAGRKRSIQDHVAPAALLRMAATLGWHPPVVDAGSPLPPLWHWLLGAPAIPSGDLGSDGHERLGLFLPDIGPAVRMWAAGDIHLIDPLRVEDVVRIESEVARVEAKRGRTGDLWFAHVIHRYGSERGLALEERQILVYRPEAAARRGVRSAPGMAPAGEELACYQIDDIALLRYSALTFNSHRIHFDRRYCEELEGDGRLVVHGPLLATILAHEAEKMLVGTLVRFSFRAFHPTRENEEFTVRLVEVSPTCHDLWIVGPDGSARMSARAETSA